MKNKKEERLIVIRRTTVQFNDLGILGKQVVWAQAAGKAKYYVWVEDELEDEEDEILRESIKQVPLHEVLKHGPNICKSKNTAEFVFDYYVEGLQSVTQDTIQYFQSKNHITIA